MLVKPSGNVMDVSELQRLNAYSPMLVTPSGMVIDVSDVQPQNAPHSQDSPFIVFTVSGSTTSTRSVLSLYEFAAISVVP